VKSGEMLGAMLLTWSNLAYYQSLMHGIREAIAAGHFADFKASVMACWEAGDIPAR
jgi:queuine tRNA-ribosyltransferase